MKNKIISHRAKNALEEQKKKEITKEIKRLIKERPTIKADEIVESLGVKAETVRYRIKVMKKLGEIRRKGSTKSGEWEVID